MKRFLVIFALLIFVGGLIAPYGTTHAANASKKHRANATLAGGIMVRFNQNEAVGPMVDDEPEEVLQARESAHKQAFVAERHAQLKRVTDTPHGVVYLMDTPVEDVETEVAQLSQDPRVDQVVPNYIVQGGPNPEVGVSFTTQSLGTVPTGRDGITVVGDLDGGIKKTDFSGRLYSVGFSILDGVQTNDPEEDPTYRHGSATAGIICTTVENGAAMKDPRKDYLALIFAIRILKPTGFGSGADLDAGARMFLNQAKEDSRIRTLNMSLINLPYDPFLEETIGEFFSIGGNTAAAAGNGNATGGRDLTNTPLYPGGFFQRTPMAVVGAMDGGHPAGFSDFYSKTTTWAQGISVDTGLGGMTLSGTSAATPQVTGGLALRSLAGDTAAAALQAVTYSANPDEELTGRVTQGGGTFSLGNLVMSDSWVASVKTPAILSLNKAKGGKFTGTISDPNLKVYVLGYPDIEIQVQSDGFFVKKNPGFNHTPVWAASPQGLVVEHAKVKGL